MTKVPKFILTVEAVGEPAYLRQFEVQVEEKLKLSGAELGGNKLGNFDRATGAVLESEFSASFSGSFSGVRALKKGRAAVQEIHRTREMAANLKSVRYVSTELG